MARGFPIADLTNLGKRLTDSRPSVWVFEISGAVPASHSGGYDKSHGNRQSVDPAAA